MTIPHTQPLIITFRGKKANLLLTPTTIVSDVKAHLVNSDVVDPELKLGPAEVKLLYKGKVLSDDCVNLFDMLDIYPERIATGQNANIKSKPIRIMAMGTSSVEAQQQNLELNIAKRNAPRIRDNLSQAGVAEIAARQRQGMNMLSKASKRDSSRDPTQKKYGFGTIQTLPMLPDQQKAKKILHDLAHDPGILACMAKHEWSVGMLCELYPEGKVGESEVCLMGLNTNKGQKIDLRLRTDDLRGFRKILSIRKVLFHELAHNTHSAHDQKFFQLMRQVEQECNDFNASGNSLGGGKGGEGYVAGGGFDNVDAFQGGTYTLGSSDTGSGVPTTLSARELFARAAMSRMSQEEQDIENACGCDRIPMAATSISRRALHSQSITPADVFDAFDDEESLS
eukprot:CAMPEP_0194086292 /NCGR_PEP_ID=MMETSP0149-20130528/20574_1 /TAXON_ID=122233 /ORGANISM="Chaetoceros debilis, Strain MM31A-1" /LENGTH=395 /DNA_ID=CAMNT_0038769355 /DNA_START=132 /DNA_END=1319 /DNA_ORIENTATION=-